WSSCTGVDGTANEYAGSRPDFTYTNTFFNAPLAPMTTVSLTGESPIAFWQAGSFTPFSASAGGGVPSNTARPVTIPAVAASTVLPPCALVVAPIPAATMTDSVERTANERTRGMAYSVRARGRERREPCPLSRTCSLLRTVKCLPHNCEPFIEFQRVPA